MKKIILSVLLATASQISFAQSTSPSPYCNAGFDDSNAGIAVPDGIDAIHFGTLNNVSNSQWPLPHYVFYNNLVIPTFNTGAQYQLSVTFNVNGGCGYGIWIDYNHNNVFDTNEKIAGTASVNDYLAFGSVTITPTITIPTTANSGNTRMRVRIVEDDNEHATTTSESACNASTSATDVMDWGETEDYTINIATTIGITEMESVSNVNLFPNPSTGIITISTENSVSENIEVYSILGTIVYTQKVNGSPSIIDLSNQPKGMYILKVTKFNKIFSVKRITLQ